MAGNIQAKYVMPDDFRPVKEVHQEEGEDFFVGEGDRSTSEREDGDLGGRASSSLEID